MTAVYLDDRPVETTSAQRIFLRELTAGRCRPRFGQGPGMSTWRRTAEALARRGLVVLSDAELAVALAPGVRLEAVR